MAWATIEGEIRGRLAETSTTGFWTSLDLARYFNDWVGIQHSEVFKRALAIERPGFGQSYENEYLQAFLKVRQMVTVSGRQDYDLPNDYWRMARVFLGTSPPIAAESVNFTDDYQVRLGGRRAPSPRRPLYAIIPNAAKAQVRLYIAPGDRTVPNAVLPFTLHYFGTPVRVDRVASPPIDTDLPVQFQKAPIAGACYLALLKERTEGSAFRDEAMKHIDTIFPAPSVEVN